VPDEPTQDRPRRRPVLLAMLVAAAVLLMVAGSGIASRSSDEGSGLSRDKPAAQQSAPGAADPGAQQFTHRGRHCHHDGNRQAPQQSPTEAPPV
jgi:cytochrome c5